MTRLAGYTAFMLAMVSGGLLAGWGRHSEMRGVPSTSCTTQSPAFEHLLACSKDLGPVSRNHMVSLLLMLRNGHAARLSSNLLAIYDPRSAHFDHFETPAEASRGGASAAAVKHVSRELLRSGLSTRWRPGDSWLSVEGPAMHLARAFDIQIHRYRGPDGRTFVASRRDPIVPRILAHDVAGASRLESYSYLRPRQTGGTGLAPTDIARAYHIDPLHHNGLDGSGQTVVFFEIDGYRQSDLDAFTSRFHLPRMRPVIKAGPSLPAGGEAPMDLEAVHAIAPGARLVVYNLDQNRLQSQSNSDDEFLDGLVRFQERIVNENPGAIVSNSVGSCAQILGTVANQALKRIYDRADALGEAWFAASGDQGAYDCLQAIERPGDPPARRDIGVDMPAAAPGVTGVGGTRISLAADGSRLSEAAWEGPAETAGGGGGVGGYFSRPSWQRARGVGDLALDPRDRREVPDVSAIADPATSGAYDIDGSPVIEGGTSQAAPIWAGIMALTDQYLVRHRAHRLGFANPALYSLARGSWPFPAFHDVVAGSNLAFPASPGYDMATGLGTPDAWNLAKDLLRYSQGRRP